MNTVKSLLPVPFGVCSYEAVSDKLINCRKKQLIPQNAQSILLFTFPYKVKGQKPQNISRYAAVADYHPIVEKYLSDYCEILKNAYPENTFVPFCDNSPVPEVYAAACAGLGVIGKNGLLITEKYGSFVFIGEIVTDLKLIGETAPKSCINCGACSKACPVGLDKQSCLSKITQQKQPLSENQQELIKRCGSAWGCDICAEICPMNKNKAISPLAEFENSYRHSFTPGEDTTNRPYIWRGTEIITRNHNIL